MIQQKAVKVILAVPLIVSVIGYKISFAAESHYKQEKHEQRIQNSTFHQFKTTLEHNFNTLKQKTDNLEATDQNLEAMNQNLEGRINVLSSEKEKLQRAYAQLKAKQADMEKEYDRLKRRTVSLEVAYKKLLSEVRVVQKSNTPKTAERKISDAKATQKNTTTAAKPKNTIHEKKGQTDRKVAKVETKRIEDTSDTAQSHSLLPTRIEPVTIPPEGQTRKKSEEVGELDIKKINEKGIEYGKKGMYDKAIKEFQKVAAIEPNMPNIHYNLGLAYKKQGMKEDAERAFAEYERLKNLTN
ncbi:MAG: tetratricopeptide repeat protein [wastewater metagenome]|nr:tetratricopeptide repeat protein [Candidatus Loosdrechtia aerotolerans]